MSKAASSKVMFGEYLPDLPPMDNPGLTEALNCIPVDRFYKEYKPVVGVGSALSERVRGGVSASDTDGNSFLYVGTETTLQQRSGTSWTDKSGATYTTSGESYWRFAQFDQFVIATNYADVPQAITAGSIGDFADLAVTGTAPRARQIGIVGQHVVLGDTNDTTNGVVAHRIQWCRIGDPTEWPVPGSADALSKQAGEQFMPGGFGPVTGIAGNDQFGVVFQKDGISRMTYVGGDIVYQFDVIDATRGATYPNAIVQDGALIYFISDDGFYVTDGVNVRPVGAGKFDRFFRESVDTSSKERVYGALDKTENLIRWIYPASGSSGGTPNRVLIYNPRENRITRAEDDIECLVEGKTVAVTLEDLDSLFVSLEDVTPSLDSQFWKGGNSVVYGFTTDHELGTFAGAAGTAVLDGQEAELFPGMRAYVSGVAPLIEGQSSITVALGTRDSMASSVSYGSPVTPTSRTRFADFRSDARYFRARVSIAGNFTAQGVLYQALPSGAA